MLRGKEKNIESMEELLKLVSHVMEDFDGAWQFNHQYHQVLQIHRETAKIEKRIDELESKLDSILDKLNTILDKESGGTDGK